MKLTRNSYADHSGTLDLLLEWHTLKHLEKKLGAQEQNSGMLVLRALQKKSGIKETTIRKVCLLTREAEAMSKWLVEHTKAAQKEREATKETAKDHNAEAATGPPPAAETLHTDLVEISAQI